MYWFWGRNRKKQSKKFSHIKPDFFTKYKSLFDKPQACHIHRFEQLALENPFPDEDKHNESQPWQTPIEHDELVYAKTRYREGESPKCLYLPSRYLMFQIMRMCSEVENVGEVISL